MDFSKLGQFAGYVFIVVIGMFMMPKNIEVNHQHTINVKHTVAYGSEVKHTHSFDPLSTMKVQFK